MKELETIFGPNLKATGADIRKEEELVKSLSGIESEETFHMFKVENMTFEEAQAKLREMGFTCPEGLYLLCIDPKTSEVREFLLP